MPMTNVVQNAKKGFFLWGTLAFSLPSTSHSPILDHVRDAVQRMCLNRISIYYMSIEICV